MTEQSVIHDLRLALDELDRLRRWNREASAVLAGWDRVADLVDPSTADLGRVHSDVVHDEILRLHETIALLRDPLNPS